MDIGIMWYDGNKKKPLTDKIQDAVEHYHRKYSKVANKAIVNPDDLSRHIGEMGGGVLVETNGILVDANRAILPDCVWVGSEARESAR